MAIDLAELGLSVRSDGVVVATERLKELEGQSKRTATVAERLEKQFMKTGNQMKTVGRNMSLYVTAPLVAAATASVALGIKFGSTLTTIHTLAGATREEVAGFREEILKISPAVGVGPVALAEGLYAVASAGQRGAEAMKTLTEAAKASTLGLGDTRVIALTVTAAMKAWETSNLSSTEALEILIGTIEQGSVEADQLAPSLGRVMGIAAEMGVTFQDVGAFIATFTRLGVDAAEATTSLRATLSALKTPNKEARDGFAAMGTSIEEVTRKIRDNGFIVTFQDLVKRSQQFGVDLVTIVPEIRALSGVLGVFGGAGKDAEVVLKGITETIGQFEERLEAMRKLDPSFPLKQLKATAETLAIELSGELLPSLLALAENIKGLMKNFRELSPETKTLIVKILALTAAIGPLLIILGALARSISILIPLFTKLRLAMLFSPVGMVAGLGALVTLIGLHYINAINDAITGTKKFTTSIKELGTVAGQQKNLAAIDERIADTVRRMRELSEEITTITSSRNDTDQIEIPGLAQLRADLDQLDREFNHLHELRRKYEEDIAALTKNEVDPGILADLAEAFKFLDELGAKQGAKFDTEAWQDLLDVVDPTTKAIKEFAEARKRIADAFAGKFINLDQFKKLNDLLDKSQLAWDAFGANVGVMRKMNAEIAVNLEGSIAYVEGLEKMKLELEGLADQLDPIGSQLRDLAKAKEDANKAFKSGMMFDGDQAALDAFNASIDKAVDAIHRLDDSFARTGAAVVSVLDSMAGAMNSGSQAQRALALAADITNTVLAIQAVLTQGQGDPYTAFGRMAAMAAAVAPLVSSVIRFAGGGGGGSQPTRTQQEMQGTGSVLGDSQAKAESILKATEITADATSELVGINRGMLHALQAMQVGIEGATVQLARGGADADFGALPDVFKPSNFMPGSLFLGKIFDKIFGGSAKLIDHGVALLGGTIDEIMFQAFQTVKVKKSIFSSSKIKESFQDLDEELSGQFGFILDSIVDTVTEAAKALGIPLDVIEARIVSFEIAAQKISLKDLNAEEAREELLAVFGEIFDDLAVHVVPFIDQFQKVGEGLGETLVRVATSVQVFQEAVKALGLSVDDSDPEKFAQMAVGIVELTGGVENFIALFTTFFDKFASEEQKLAFSTDQLTRAFSSVGLTLPATRDGMFELMQSLDASTEAGQRQIAMLLNTASAADEYYSLLEAAEEARLKALAPMEGETSVDVFTRLASSLFDAMAVFDGTPEKLIEIADAFGTVQQAGINAIAHIDAAWKSMTATIDRLRQDTLDIIAGPKSDRDIFVEAAGLVDQVKNAKTPEEIARITERFDALIRQLPPETAQRLGADLISLIDKFQLAADTSFAGVRDLTMDAIQSVNAMADAFLTRIPDSLLALVSSNERVALMLENMASQARMIPSSANYSIAKDVSLAGQNQILIDGTNRMASALQSGVRDLQNNVAGAVQSGLSNARVVVHVHVNNRKGLTTQ